jgi:hypothetical protein
VTIGGEGPGPLTDSATMSGVFGLDEKIASLASGKPLVALAVALLLGLRHPFDPDHLAAVGAMAKNSRARSALIGLSWGAGQCQHRPRARSAGRAVGGCAARERASGHRGTVVFAFSTALAMGAVAAGLGGGAYGPWVRAGPLGGLVSAFGLWYLAAAAVGAPYPF